MAAWWLSCSAITISISARPACPSPFPQLSLPTCVTMLLLRPVAPRGWGRDTGWSPGRAPQPAVSVSPHPPQGTSWQHEQNKPRKQGPTRLLTRKTFGQAKEETNTEAELRRAAISLPAPNFCLQRHPPPRCGSVYKTLPAAPAGPACRRVPASLSSPCPRSRCRGRSASAPRTSS